MNERYLKQFDCKHEDLVVKIETTSVKWGITRTLTGHARVSCTYCGQVATKPVGNIADQGFEYIEAEAERWFRELFGPEKLKADLRAAIAGLEADIQRLQADRDLAQTLPAKMYHVSAIAQQRSQLEAWKRLWVEKGGSLEELEDVR